MSDSTLKELWQQVAEKKSCEAKQKELTAQRDTLYTIFREFVYLHLKKKQIKQVTKTEIEEYTAEEIVNSDISEVK